MTLTVSHGLGQNNSNLNSIDLGVAILILNFFNDRSALALAWFTFAILGGALSYYDFKFHRLPNKLNVALFLIGLTLLSMDAIQRNRLNHLQSALIAAGMLSALFLIARFLSRGGMGMGDVKLAATIGLYTGYISTPSVYLAAMASFALGSAFGIGNMLLGKGTRQSAIAFGPFMIVGALVSAWLTTHL